MHDHPLMTQMRRGRPAKQWRVIEHPERPSKDYRRHNRMGDELGVGGVQRPHHPFTSAPRTITPFLNRSKQKRHGGRQNQEHRDAHGEQHMREHVHAEQVLFVGVERPVGDIEEQQHSRDPEDGAVHGPAIAPTRQANHARYVKEDCKRNDEDPRQIKTPGGENGVHCELWGQWLPGEPFSWSNLG